MLVVMDVTAGDNLGLRKRDGPAQALWHRSWQGERNASSYRVGATERRSLSLEPLTPTRP